MDLIVYALLKKQIDEIKDLSPFTYMGSVANKSELPNKAKKGQVYTTLDDGSEYLYDGKQWIDLGVDITELKKEVADLKANSLEIKKGVNNA